MSTNEALPSKDVHAWARAKASEKKKQVATRGLTGMDAVNFSVAFVDGCLQQFRDEMGEEPPAWLSAAVSLGPTVEEYEEWWAKKVAFDAAFNARSEDEQAWMKRRATIAAQAWERPGDILDRAANAIISESRDAYRRETGKEPWDRLVVGVFSLYRAICLEHSPTQNFAPCLTVDGLTQDEAGDVHAPPLSEVEPLIERAVARVVSERGEKEPPTDE